MFGIMKRNFNGCWIQIFYFPCKYFHNITLIPRLLRITENESLIDSQAYTNQITFM